MQKRNKIELTKKIYLSTIIKSRQEVKIDKI